MNTLKEKINYFVNTLENSNYLNFNYDFKDFYQFILSNEITSNMIKVVNCNVDFNRLEKETEGRKIIDKFNEYRGHRIKNISKYERIYYLLKVLNFANTYSSSQYGFINELNLGEKYSDNISSFIEVCIKPITQFFIENLKNESQILALLLKYKKYKEWFSRETFFELYEKSDRLESFLDDDLRKFLFENGIEFPFSSPKTSSGRADIVANIETNDPLVLEVKMLDKTKNYYKSRISDGFKQCIKYSNDYLKNIGYIVVFNCDSEDIELVIEDANKEYPHNLFYNGKNYFFIVVNINPNGKSASKVNKIIEVKMTINELLGS